jgi:O-methyltransferase
MGVGDSVRRLTRRAGYEVVRYPPSLEASHPDFDAADRELVARVRPYTMTTPERIVALARAVEYVVDRGIEGAIVECGVWKGGSMMVVALTLARLGAASRDLYLYDTYEGMSEPTADDVSAADGRSAADLLAADASRETSVVWAYAQLDEVTRNLASTGYDPARLHFVEGKVEETIPGVAPESIALLRLDTDWYESTRHELIHLYPRLAAAGVLIIDDYGYWKGSRKATDEYFSQPGIPRPLLTRVDSTGRVAVKS